MAHCAKCNRWFVSREALQQHIQDSKRHTADTPSTETASPINAFVPRHDLSGLALLTTPAIGNGNDSLEAVKPEMAEEQPLKILIKSLKGLYSSGEHSDLVISCQGKEYRVHKAIVCPRSDFFSTACRSDFKEAQEGKIDLPDDDPELVRIMIYYLYHLDYSVSPPQKQVVSDLEDAQSKNETLAKPTMGVLTTHAKVYTLAEKYLIQGLKTLALQKFTSAIASSIDVDDYLEAAQEAYTSTIHDDRGLRDAIVETLYIHADWLDKENVRRVIQNLGALTYDLVIYMRHRRATWGLY
ncbi:hypothetical protein VTH06DRAFT_4039 [Thermothelomyces fergusii]